MSSINSVRNLKILYFSRKNKEIKKNRKMQKKVASNPHLYILLVFNDLREMLVRETLQKRV